MRQFFSHRASLKRSSQNKDKVGNMAATSDNATTDSGDSGVVVATAGGGSGGSSSGGSGSHAYTTSPVPDWSGGEPVSLKDFASQKKVPGFARVVKGSYMTIGSSKFSFQKQHHDVYIHSVKVGVKVLAHCMKRVESHRRGQTHTRLCSMDQLLTVPIAYQGWFELLSEDGKSARTIASVPELAKVFPNRCLVRENVKGYLSTGAGRLTFDKTKIIPAGEQLKLCGQLSLPAPSEGVKVKLLHCTDTKGDSVYLSFDQKGVFTPISGENDFTGVFNIRDIVRRFRLPLTVKLAHGVRPRVPDSKFSGLIRLDWVFTDETAFVCPLEKNHVRLLPVPCDVSLQLVAASNQEDLCNSHMFRAIQEKCARMVSNYNNTLHLIVALPDSVAKTQTQSSRDSNIFSTPLQASSEDSTPMRRSKSREDMLMDEIDDLYSYVRDGGVPPKSRFQYDSDEESYWEEPAYEPLDKFRARVEALGSGQKVDFPDRYRPADPTQLPGLVGGNGDVVPPSPVTEGATGVGEEDIAVSFRSSTPDDEPSATTVHQGPPPLPPRPADLSLPPRQADLSLPSRPADLSLPPRQADLSLPSRPADLSLPHRPAGLSLPPRPADLSLPSTNVLSPLDSTATVTATTDSSFNSTSTSVPHRPTHSRGVSVPLLPSSFLQEFKSRANENWKEPDEEFSVETKDSAKIPPSDNPPDLPPRGVLPSSDNAPEVPQRRVLRSDSEPSISVPLSPNSSSSAATNRHNSHADIKSGWKERLRRMAGFHDKDREGSTSTSSGSGPGRQKGAQRLARDFKDSDISSRTKASSSSSGDRGVRKRMQTLYL